MTALHAYSTRQPELAACNYDFRDEGIDLLSIPGVTVKGRAEIEIDGLGEWYVYSIATGEDACRPLDRANPLFAAIKNALEARAGDKITEACEAAAQEW